MAERILFKSTTYALDQFERSAIWYDMRLEIRLWIQQIHMEMENASSDEFRELQGSIKFCRRFETILDNIREDIQSGDQGTVGQDDQR